MLGLLIDPMSMRAPALRCAIDLAFSEAMSAKEHTTSTCADVARCPLGTRRARRIVTQPHASRLRSMRSPFEARPWLTSVSSDEARETAMACRTAHTRDAERWRGTVEVAVEREGGGREA